ncbi:MAG: hypothetical protein EBT09_02655 [Actinobacteria bacterium]|nr:hypothetical protein [Actinomycetota bacterium]
MLAVPRRTGVTEDHSDAPGTEISRAPSRNLRIPRWAGFVANPDAVEAVYRPGHDGDGTLTAAKPAWPYGSFSSRRPKC